MTMTNAKSALFQTVNVASVTAIAAMMVAGSQVGAADSQITDEPQSARQSDIKFANGRQRQQSLQRPSPEARMPRTQTTAQRRASAAMVAAGAHLIVLPTRKLGREVRPDVAAARAQALKTGRALLETVNADATVISTIKVTTGALDVIYVAGLDAQQVSALQRDPRIASVDAVVEFAVDGIDTNTQNWGADRIDQVNLPLDTTHQYSDAADVDVYILDSGVDAAHQEFGGRVIEAVNFTGEAAQTCDNHGTYSASFAAGSTRGIARNAPIHDVKVATCTGGGTNFDLIAGINHVVNTRTGPAVINISLSFNASVANVNNAVVNAVNAGVAVVTSSGNNSGLACIRSPNMVSEILTVGATRANDSRPAFSNRGWCVDLHAPGELVNGAQVGGGYGTVSGTSESAPAVAGIVAAIWSENPGMTAAQAMQATVDAATPDILTNIPSGTPNRLAHYRPGSGTSAGNTPPIAFPKVNWSYVFSGRGGVILDAAQSSDPDGHLPLTYQWTQTLGPPVVLSNPNSPTPTFTAPVVTSNQNLNFDLVVTDALGLQSAQQALVAVVVTPDACTPYNEQRLLAEFPILTGGPNSSSTVRINQAKVEATLTQWLATTQSSNPVVSGAILTATLADLGNGTLPSNLPGSAIPGAALHSASLTQNGFVIGNQSGPAASFWDGTPIAMDRWYRLSTNLRPVHNAGGMSNDCTDASIVFRVPKSSGPRPPRVTARPVDIWDGKSGTTRSVPIRTFSLPANNTGAVAKDVNVTQRPQ